MASKREQRNTDGRGRRGGKSRLRGVMGTRAKESGRGVRYKGRYILVGDPRTSNIFQQRQEESEQRNDLQTFPFLKEPSSCEKEHTRSVTGS